MAEFLGKGGEGEVWRALDLLVEQGQVSVALKFLPPELLHDQSQRTRITKCYTLCSQFRHRSICWIKNLEEDDQHGMFLIMEFLDGVDLRAYREVLLEQLRAENPSSIRQGLIPIREVTQLLRPIAEGLDYLHNPRATGSNFEPIAHRDVKPANIKVRESNGLARLLDQPSRQICSMDHSATGSITTRSETCDRRRPRRA